MVEYGLLVQACAFLILRFLDRLLMERDMVAVGQPLDGFHIGHAFFLFEEGDDAASLTATEAFVDVPGGIDVERRCFLVVEGTVAHVARAGFLEGKKLTDHICYVRSGEYFFYFVLRNHENMCWYLSIPYTLIGNAPSHMRAPSRRLARAFSSSFSMLYIATIFRVEIEKETWMGVCSG